MNRRDFIKSGLLTPFIFLPLETSPDQENYPKTLGILTFSGELWREWFDSRNESDVERKLLALGFPEDLRVIRVYQEPKDIPFERYNILASHAGFARVAEGEEIPRYSPKMYRLNNQIIFGEWA